MARFRILVLDEATLEVDSLAVAVIIGRKRFGPRFYSCISELELQEIQRELESRARSRVPAVPRRVRPQ